MRVFITGIGGFAGSHLADHLLALGHEVSGLILPEAGRENVAHLAGRVALHAGNLLDSARLKELLLRERPEWVFHLAAQSSVAASWENPAETFEVNAVGGARLLEGCLPLKGRVRVARSGCLDLCEKGPNAFLYPEGRWYSGLKPEDVPALLAEVSTGSGPQS